MDGKRYEWSLNGYKEWLKDTSHTYPTLWTRVASIRVGLTLLHPDEVEVVMKDHMRAACAAISGLPLPYQAEELKQLDI